MESKSQIIQRQAVKICMLEALLVTENNLWGATEHQARKNQDSARIHIIESLDSIIQNEKRLYNLTACTLEMFAYILEKFIEEVFANSDRPLFREDKSRAQDPGTRCALHIRHVLLLVLICQRTGMKQVELGAMFGVDQGTVSKHLAFARPILAKILPTAENTAAQINKELDIKQLVPQKTFYVDGTVTPVTRSMDSETRRDTYSGRHKKHAYNTLIIANQDGLVIDTSKTAPGSKHDFGILKEHKMNFGVHAKSMKNPNTPQQERITVYSDLGFEGINKVYPGIISKQPKKKPKNGTLTKPQRKRNKRINAKRVHIEHVIGRLKNFGVLTIPYDDTPDKFNAELQLITGIENLHIMMRHKKYRKFLS